MALQTVPMRCCDGALILKGVDWYEKVGKTSLNLLCGGKICMDEVDMMMLDVEDVHHPAGPSCVHRCDSTAIRSMRTVTRRSWKRWMSAVWRVCWRGEEKLLANNRLIGLVVRKEWTVVMTRDLLLLFVDKRSHVLENQKTVSIEAIMRGLVMIGDYELLEKRKEGYERK